MRPSPRDDIGSLDIRTLRAFMEVCDTGHFAQAAANLSISPSALSRSIKSLEEWSGVLLLVRTARRADLTPAGRSLLPLARAVLDDVLRLREAAVAAGAGRRGILKVGFMDVVIADFLPGVIAGHRRSNPDIDLRLVYGWKEQQHIALLEGRLDIAFTVGPLADREIISRRYKRYHLMLMLPAGHPLADRKAIDLYELADQPFVFGIKNEWQSLREIVEQLCAEAHFQPHIVEEAPSRDALFGFVAGGLGLTIYPQIDALLLRPGLAAVPIEGTGAELDVFVSHRRNPPPLLSRFLAELGGDG